MDSPKYKFQKDEVKAKATKKKYYMNECKLNLKPQEIFAEKHIHICIVRKNLSKKVWPIIFGCTHLQRMAWNICMIC